MTRTDVKKKKQTYSLCNTPFFSRAQKNAARINRRAIVVHLFLKSMVCISCDEVCVCVRAYVMRREKTYRYSV